MNTTLRARLVDLSFGRNRKQRLTLELDADFRSRYDELDGKDLDMSLKEHRQRRSLSANAYFHLLVNRIADALQSSDEEVKRNLVTEYGALDADEDGQLIGFKLPASVDVGRIYPYTRCFDTRRESGKLFKCYLVYKRTRSMNSREMARLIDGAIQEARELGIETDTPEQLARYKELWSREAQKKGRIQEC